jgi:hypothetical protein
MGAGWLQSLKEESTIQIDDGKGGKKTVPKPETLEYVTPARDCRHLTDRQVWDWLLRLFCPATISPETTMGAGQ